MIGCRLVVIGSVHVGLGVPWIYRGRFRRPPFLVTVALRSCELSGPSRDRVDCCGPLTGLAGARFVGRIIRPINPGPWPLRKGEKRRDEGRVCVMSGEGGATIQNWPVSLGISWGQGEALKGRCTRGLPTRWDVRYIWAPFPALVGPAFVQCRPPLLRLSPHTLPTAFPPNASHRPTPPQAYICHVRLVNVET